MIPDWEALSGEFDARLVTSLRALYETPGSFSIVARDLARDTKTTSAEAEALLGRLVQLELLERKTFRECAHCGHRLDDSDREKCPACGTWFVDQPPKEEVRYVLSREAPRDVRWVLVLHGMNTSGTWQEELSWLISRSYRRTVPVAIYKYGIVRPGVLFRWRQRMIRRGLVAKIVKLSGEASGSGFGGKPDVIAHSFGTWLITDALAKDDRVRIGRLILLGSIVPPDFNWTSIRGHVEAILNHGATADAWVRVAQLAIPSSGPSGVRGLCAPAINVAASGLGHSDYFAPDDRMRELFSRVWRPFLSWETLPTLPGTFTPRKWRALPRIITFITRWTAIALMASILYACARLLYAVLACLGS